MTDPAVLPQASAPGAGDGHGHRAALAEVFGVAVLPAPRPTDADPGAEGSPALQA